jgi:prepilin-type N-terminal cleavage/methylation domain-containing protein
MRNIFKLGSSGLTMMELLIVIAVIAILSSATIAVFPFINSQRSDANRLNEMAEIQKELERGLKANPDDYQYPASYSKPNFCYEPVTDAKGRRTGYKLYTDLKYPPSGSIGGSCGGNTYSYMVEMK